MGKKNSWILCIDLRLKAKKKKLYKGISEAGQKSGLLTSNYNYEGKGKANEKEASINSST